MCGKGGRERKSASVSNLPAGNQSSNQSIRASRRAASKQERARSGRKRKARRCSEQQL